MKKELDSIIPLASSLFQTATSFYNIGNFEEAERELLSALNVNPDHFEARLLLGDILIAQGKIEEAVKEVEYAYNFDPSSAKPEFIKVLLALAKSQNTPMQWSTYNRILNIDPNQLQAKEEKKKTYGKIC